MCGCVYLYSVVGQGYSQQVAGRTGVAVLHRAQSAGPDLEQQLCCLHTEHLHTQRGCPCYNTHTHTHTHTNTHARLTYYTHSPGKNKLTTHTHKWCAADPKWISRCLRSSQTKYVYALRVTCQLSQWIWWVSNLSVKIKCNLPNIAYIGYDKKVHSNWK